LNTHRFSIGIITALLAASLVTSARAAPATPHAGIGTTFTYRGQLRNGNTPVNGACDITFNLYDAVVDGTLIAGPLTHLVVVTNSLFTTALDFGAGVFAGDARWLDLAVRCPAGAGAFTALTPRQEVTAVPNALYASNAGLLNGRAASEFVDLASAQDIAGVKTFAGGVRFPDGTQMNTAPYRPALPGPGVATNIDSPGSVGGYTAIVIGADGLGLISYHDYTNNVTKVLHCGNPACNGGNTSRSINSGLTNAIAIGADGLGMIWYGDPGLAKMRFAHCSNSTCSSSYTDGEFTGSDPSIAIGTDGLALVSYYDQVSGDLKVLHCDHITCLQIDLPYAPITLDSAGDVGKYSAITIGADGLGLISYLDTTNANLKVLHCGNSVCDTGNTITTVDSTGQPGSDTSITIGADGLGLISYYDVTNADLKILHCGNATCSSGNTITTVDSSGNVGINAAIALGSDGLAVVSYYDATNRNLKALHCGNAACSSGNVATTVDMPNDAWNGSDDGYYTSIALGADGLMLISYYSQTAFDLKVFHCSNVTCTPYTRVGR
jgi:hypothetical protein